MTVLTLDEWVDTEVGAAIQSTTWRQRLTGRKLAANVGLGQSTLSKKMRGQVAWEASNICKVALATGVEPASFLPTLAELREAQALYTTRDLNPEPAD